MPRSIRNRNWVYTLNNYTEDEIKTTKDVESRYSCMGFEVGDQGTPHLQGCLVFRQPKTLVHLRKVLPRAHWEPMRGTPKEASDYCKKDGTFFESGDLPAQGKRTDIDKAIATLKASGYKRVAEDHPREFVKYHRGFKELELALSTPYTHPTVRGIWIYGPPGTGKSHAARNFSDDIYIKSQNKWFDGYSGQSVILLDDLDSDCLHHHLKIWTDRYSCTGETKGGTVQLKHRLFVITSNYSISELFESKGDDAIEAMERRCKIIEKTEKCQLIDFLILK